MKFRFNKHILWLLVILLLACVLRLWQLGTVPPSPDWDEAALGYNALSILQTGRDEYGSFLPVMLESFGDYKPALYTYLIIPLIPIFGLDIFAVRLPSVIAGVFAVWLTYLLVKEMFSRQESVVRNLKIHKKNKSSLVSKSRSLGNLLSTAHRLQTIPLLSAFLLAISPWHIQFSRVAFEANVAVTLNLAMVYFFLRGLRSPQMLSLSAFFAALSLYAYQSEKVFVPLLVLVLVLIYLKELFQISRKYLGMAFVIGILVAFPMIFSLITNGDALERARSTNILANQTELLEKSIERLEISKENNDLIGLVVDNRRVIFTREIAKNYLAHFNPNWLFITGDAPRHHAPFMGLLYLWELPFLCVGIYTLVFYRKRFFAKQENTLLFLWFLLAPLPAAVTNDVPHAVRTLNFLPTFQIFTAIGIIAVLCFVYASIHLRVLRFTFYVLALLFVLFNIMYFLNQYFVQQNYFFSEHWQYGYKEAVQVAEEKKDSYEKIVVSNQVPMDQSYIFFLYYLHYSPQRYQQNQENNKAFGKYEFRPLVWEKDEERENTLFIGSPSDFPKDIEPIYTVDYLNGEPAILFIDPQN